MFGLETGFVLALFFLTVALCDGLRKDACIDGYVEVTLSLLKNERREQILQFRAWGRSYRLWLWPTTNVFDRNGTVNIILGNGTLTTTYERYAENRNIPPVIFEGSVEGDASSDVFATIDDDGVFDGHFRHGNVVYYLEPRSRYVGEGRHDRHPNAILYRLTDVRSDCNGTPGHDGRQRLPLKRYVHYEPMALETEEKRVQNSSKIHVIVKTCELKLIADFRFYHHVLEKRNVSEAELIWTLEAVDRKLRHLDFDLDGKPDLVGIRVTRYDVFTVPIREDLVDVDRWDPVRFFEEFRLYDFGGYCGGFLLTYRQMEGLTDVNGPSLFRSNPVSYEQGLCSSLPVGVPNGSLHDYGAYFANALPVNFMVRSDQKMINENALEIVQFLHQFLHLMGMWEDDEFNDGNCYGLSQFRPKRVILRPHERSRIRHIGEFPLPPPGTYNISNCTVTRVQTFLQVNGRPCLKMYPAHKKTWDPNLLWPRKIRTPLPTTTAPTTSEPTIDDWTEVCFITLINSATGLQSAIVLLLLLGQLLTLLSYFLQ